MKTDFGKYFVIFAFMVATIGLISGFLVADESMLEAYQESFEKYQVENGHFELDKELSQEQIESIQEENVTLYRQFYMEASCMQETKEQEDPEERTSTLRVFAKREQVNLECLMKGEFPQAKDEIAVDRMYADNRGLSVGDQITVDGQNLKITGLVALSDYSALFSDNGDMMFDAVKFGVGVMTEEGLDTLDPAHLHYVYAWKYQTEPKDETEEMDRAEELVKKVAACGMVRNFIPRCQSQAIRFTGDDMGSDRSMMIVLLYILIALMAFIFAVTTSNTIVREAAVIGTLRATGYTRRELLVHYLKLPLLVTVVAALIGNVLGYTVFKDVCAGMYYGSYSLPTYETRWNAQAFLLTTVVPLLIMLAVNIWIISRKLRLSPLRFLRRDLEKRGRKKAVRLPRWKFFNRFRLRIILQNRSGYLVMFIGILFANLLLLFGMMMTPLLTHFQDQIQDSMLAKYQYVLKAPVPTDTEGAEKYGVSTLQTQEKDMPEEEVSVYGIENGSRYMKEALSGDGVLVSDSYADKYGIRAGDEITLKDKYGDETYPFTVDGIYEYPAALALFMPIDQYRETFDLADDAFSGYFSDQEITDIDDAYIYTTITEEDLTKVSRQLEVSMGSMFYLLHGFSIVLFALLVYLLTKLIIEKNETSISMLKILGYRGGEIRRLYLTATAWVVLISEVVGLLGATEMMRLLWRAILSEMNGWMSFYVEPVIYPEMFAMGIIVYFLVERLEFVRIRKIPMEQALKNVE